MRSSSHPPSGGYPGGGAANLTAAPVSEEGASRTRPHRSAEMHQRAGRAAHSRHVDAPREDATVSTWKTIVVGVDGSRGSRSALTWAAAEAADHRADLVVLKVWERALLAPLGSGSVPPGDVQDPAEQAANDLV